MVSCHEYSWMYMNKKVAITNPVHPKFIIQHAVDSVVRDLYDVSWHPRVVRQKSRNITGSTLQFIDYAIPCFELSKQVAEPLDDLTSKLVAALKEKVNMKPDSEYFKYLEFEAVGGYINVQLADKYLAVAIENTQKWLNAPEYLYQPDPTTLLIVGYHKVPRKDDTALLAVQISSELAAILGSKFSSSYLFEDISESVLPELTLQYLEELGVSAKDLRQNMEVSRTLKRLLEAPSQDDSNANATQQITQLTKILADSKQHTKILLNSGVETVCSESELQKEVQTFINTHVAKTGLAKKLIFDDANFAVYYSSDDTIQPIRSAEGYLYSNAYILYSIFKQCNPKNVVGNTVIMAPQRLHAMLREFYTLLFGSDARECVFFDPQVSKADLRELGSTDIDLENLFQKFSDTLQSNALKLNDPDIRQKLLLLVDFPIDITIYLLDLQLPIVFDLLNHAALATQ